MNGPLIYSARHAPQARTVALLNETTGPGGAEVLLLHMAEGLRSRGHRVVVVLPDRGGWLVERLHETGIPMRPFTLRGAVDARAVQDLAATLAKDHVDVVHSHEFTMAVYGAAAAGQVRRPHVISMHGNQTMTKAWRRRVALKWAFRQSQAVAAVSASTRTHLIDQLGLEPEQVVTVPNGIPQAVGDPRGIRTELGIPEETPIVLGVGSLVERKGFHILLDALAEVHERRSGLPWQLVVAGQGPWKDRLEAQAAELGLEGQVRFLGLRGDIPDLQAAADVFVMPSLWEGLPLAVLEGMFAGNPIVATEASGIPEAVSDGVEGFLVRSGESALLGQALERLLTDPELSSRMGGAARSRAERCFTLTRMLDDYEALYAGRPRPGAVRRGLSRSAT